MKQPLFTGCGVAIVTPFHGGCVDYEAFHRLVDWQIKSGTDAIIVCGTTGEAATLTHEERTELIKTCVAQVDHRVPVIAGSGSNNTAAAIRLSEEAQALGADGLLVVTPYYNKATQRGLIRHFTAVADAVELPVILYNVPSRTGVSCTAETYAALAQHPNINGVKEASGSFALIQDTLNLCPAGFSVWSGNDEDTTAVMALGGRGVISVAANIIPREMHTLTELCLRDEFAAAGALQLRMAELIRSLFCEVNPIPVKAAMEELALCGGELRLPMCGISSENRARVKAAMERFGVAVP